MSDPKYVKWYHASSDDAEQWDGGFATREDAVKQGEYEYGGRPFHVVEADSAPVRLASWIMDGAEVLDRAGEDLYDSDRVYSEFDEGPVFEASHAQIEDLHRRLKEACDAWQEAHGLVFTVQTFSWMGTPQRIVPVIDTEGIM